jgi:hypothetical protein
MNTLYLVGEINSVSVGEILPDLQALDTLLVCSIGGEVGPMFALFDALKALECDTVATGNVTTVRLKVEENQLVDVFGEIGFHVDGLKGA